MCHRLPAGFGTFATSDALPDQHQVMTRYYGWYANWTRGKRRQRAGEGSAEAELSRVAAGEALPLREARRR